MPGILSSLWIDSSVPEGLDYGTFWLYVIMMGFGAIEYECINPSRAYDGDYDDVDDAALEAL